MLIVYPQPGATPFRAIYFDNEGHTIQYEITIDNKTKQLIFAATAAEGGPRFRLLYDLAPDGQLVNDFQIAMPGKDFQSHMKGYLKKVK